MEAVVLDALGLYCPEPILLLTEEMEKLNPGERLLLMLDDPSGREDVERWCRRTGNVLASFVEKQGEMHFMIEKKG